MKFLAAVLGFSALPLIGASAQSRQRDLPAGFRSLAGVALNRDSAGSIRTKLGRTPERRVGADHDVFASWCYVASSESMPVLLELLSDVSDMGSPGRALNVIRLRTGASPQDRHGCRPLRPSAALSTPSGLRLGLTGKDAQSLLGRPARTTGDSLIYEFEAKEYMRRGTREYRAWNTPDHRTSCFDGGPPYANVGATVILILINDRVAEIRLERYDQSTC